MTVRKKKRPIQAFPPLISVTGPTGPIGPTGYVTRTAASVPFVQEYPSIEKEIAKWVEERFAALVAEQNVLIATMQEQIDELWEEIRGD